MTVLANAYNMGENEVGIAAETTVGTAKTTGMIFFNTSSDAPYPTLNAFTDHVVRSGAGRTAKAEDMFTEQWNQEKVYTITGVADEQILALLLANVMGNAAVSPAAFNMIAAYAPAGILHGAAATDATKTLTVALKTPVPGDAGNITLAGCTCRKLTLDMAFATDGGRMNFTAEMVTKYKPIKASGITGSPSTRNYLTIRSFSCVKQSVFGVDVVMDALSLTIDNPAGYHGCQGIGDPQTINRGMPETMVTGTLSVKYDDNTADFWTRFGTGAGLSPVGAIEISNNATFASATLGVLIASAIVTDSPTLSQNGADGAFKSFGFKAVASTTNLMEFKSWASA